MKKTIISALIFAAFTAASASAEVVEAVIARVGDRIITRTQYLSRLNSGYEELARNLQPSELAARREQFRSELLNEMLSELLLKDRADRIGITVTPQEVNDAIERLKAQYGLKSEAEFIDSLQKSGLTRSDMEGRLRDTLITNKLFARELRDRVSLTDRELRERYDREKERYRRPERARVREIVVTAETAGAEEKIQQTLARAKAGEDFAKLAAEVSESPTKTDGGNLGLVAKGELLAELDQAVFAAPAGSVAGPIRTRSGFHLLKVDERLPSDVPSFDAVKEQLRKDASEETFQRDYKAYVERLRKDAFLEIYENNVPKA